MKQATLALALVAPLAAAPLAGAQDQSAGSETDARGTDQATAEPERIRASDLVGNPLYTVGNGGDIDWGGGDTLPRVTPNMTQVGAIEDLVLARDGRFVGIVAEVGGTLDYGDRHVMIDLADLRIAADEDTTVAITRLGLDELMGRDDIDRAVWN